MGGYDLGQLYIHLCDCSEHEPKKYCMECLVHTSATRHDFSLEICDFTNFVLENKEESMQCPFCRVGKSCFFMDERDWPDGNKIYLPNPVGWIGDRACRTTKKFQTIRKVYSLTIQPYVEEYMLVQGLLYLNQDTLDNLPQGAFDRESNPDYVLRLNLEQNDGLFKKALTFFGERTHSSRNAWLFHTVGYPENDIPSSIMDQAADIEAGRTAKIDPNRDIFRGDYKNRAFYFRGVKKMMEEDAVQRVRLGFPGAENARVISRAYVQLREPTDGDVSIHASMEYPEPACHLFTNAEWREFLGDEQYVEMKETTSNN